MWGPFRELPRQRDEVQSIALLERPLPDPVLLGMVLSAEADRVLIRGLETDPAITLGANMSAFDRPVLAAGYRALMAPYPCAMARRAPVVGTPAVGMAPLGQTHHAAF